VPTKETDRTSAVIVRNDEPAETDTLDRGRYARAFARLAQTCETPMVVGLYGGWGVGKTSLMRQVQREVQKLNIPTVWFDPWRHQFDEDPVIALLQTMAFALQLDREGDVRQILTTVALALGSPLLKWTNFGLSVTELRRLHAEVAKERFDIRDAQIRLREAVGALIQRVRDTRGADRVVFFIDDLDRCLPATMLKMLEALKLYLNLPSCVYVLGLDHRTVRAAIKTNFKDMAVSEQDYLDKIVQLPFVIPRIHPDHAQAFIQGLLPDAAKACAGFLAEFLGNNPRAVKRFVNILSINLLLAAELIKQPDATVVAVLLLIQQRNEALFARISANTALYRNLTVSGDAAAKLTEEYFAGDTRLQALVQRIGGPDDIATYVHLSAVAGASVRSDDMKPIEPEMVVLEPDTFLMGSPDGDPDAHPSEKPQHEVTIGYRFAVGRTPVTFAEYDRFCEATGRPPPEDQGWGRERRPVIYVTWHDATAYCQWLAVETGKPYRLLTEAEWEYACRAGTTTRYSVGDEITERDANFGGTVGETTEVGAYPANPWGLSDMHGNVSEWVEGVWHENYQDAPTDGSARTDGAGIISHPPRVIRGGSWDVDPRHLRSAFRYRYSRHLCGDMIGFRVARTVD
jgi:formylglycine-generating enzyme required for sulfatase activity